MAAADPVRHPRHYTAGQIETIEIIKDSVPDFASFCMGNVLKYVIRHPHKGTPVEDLRKARVYLDWLIEYHDSGGGDAG